MTRGTALVRRPSPRLAEGLLTHLDRRPVDPAAALAQWRAYTGALAAAGWSPTEVPPSDGHPDGVFVEDTAVVVGDLAVVTRPGAAARRPETRTVEPALARLGLTVERMRGPATLDGGDVLEVGSTVYVGRSGRTNAEGVAQLAALLDPHGRTVVPVPVTRVLHLKSAVTALPDGTVVGYLPLVDDPTAFPAFREVPEQPGSALVPLGDRRVLLAADAPRTAELLGAWGYEPVPVDVGEFAKLEGCVTCLSVRVPGRVAAG